MPDSPLVLHGYTLADIDQMAWSAVRADRSLASDARARYDTAWSAIALALAEAPHWPRRESLVQAGWQAIYAEVRATRHTFGMARDGSDAVCGVGSGQRFQEFWWHGTVQFEDALVERLSVGRILATLTETERAAVVALAVHDDYRAAARHLGISYTALTVRLSNARKRFWRRWYAPDAAPKVKGTDRRVEAHGKAPATHCHAGHEWTPENTRWRRDKQRTCRACERARVRPSRAVAS